jgi:multiple sugar transport system ATP-binding protein
MNFLDAEVTESGTDETKLMLRGNRKALAVEQPLPLARGTAVSLGIRPDALALVDEDKADISGAVEVVEHLGSESVVHFMAPGINGLLTAVAPGKTRLRHGAPIHLRLDRSLCHVFDANGEAVRNAA